MKEIVGAFVALAFVLLAAWLVAGNGLALMAVFSPAYEEVRRETFEQSKAYRDGKVQELRSLQFEYVKAAPEHKAGLAQIIKHKAAGVPADVLPADLHAFLNTLN